LIGLSFDSFFSDPSPSESFAVLISCQFHPNNTSFLTIFFFFEEHDQALTLLSSFLDLPPTFFFAISFTIRV